LTFDKTGIHLPCNHSQTTKPTTMKTEKTTWYWVIGNPKKGFTVTTKRPRAKHVEEPHRTERGAYLWIANYFSQNA